MDTSSVSVRRSSGVARLVALVLLGIGSVLAHLGSGLLVLFIFAMTALPGRESAFLLTKWTIAFGWLALAAWLVYDVANPRFRMAVPAIIGWLWVWGLGLTLRGIAILNIGH